MITKQILNKYIELLSNSTVHQNDYASHFEYQHYFSDNKTYFACGYCINKYDRINTIDNMLSNIKSEKFKYHKFEKDGIIVLVPDKKDFNYKDILYKPANCDLFIKLKYKVSKKYPNAIKVFYENTYDKPKCSGCQYNFEIYIDKENSITIEDFYGRYELPYLFEIDYAVEYIDINTVHQIVNKCKNKNGDIFLLTNAIYGSDKTFTITNGSHSRKLEIEYYVGIRDGYSFRLHLIDNGNKHIFKGVKTNEGKFLYFDDELLEVIYDKYN